MVMEAGAVRARKNLREMSFAELEAICFDEEGQWMDDNPLSMDNYLELCKAIDRKNKKLKETA